MMDLTVLLLVGGPLMAWAAVRIMEARESRRDGVSRQWINGLAEGSRKREAKRGPKRSGQWLVVSGQ